MVGSRRKKTERDFAKFRTVLALLSRNQLVGGSGDARLAISMGAKDRPIST